MLTFYVGCALTFATEAYKAAVEECKKILRKDTRHNVKDFMGLINGGGEHQNGRIYTSDIIEGVGGCVCFVCFVDGPSTGVGLELGAALFKFGVPVLILANVQSKVSAIILDLPFHFPDQVTILRYEDMHTDVPVIIREYCERLGLYAKHCVVAAIT